MIYFICVATLLFFGYFTRNSKQYFIFSIVLLFCFTAFRDINLGGTDAIAYQSFFSSVPTTINEFFKSLGSFKYEDGYTFINVLVKIFKNDYFVYQVIYSSLSLFLLYRLIIKLELSNKEKCLFLFIYFCFRYFLNNFVLLRQNIANLIIWTLIIENWSGIKKTAIAVYISTLFHSTSTFNFLIWPIIKKIEKIEKKRVLIATFIISIILLFAGSGVINSAINFFVNFAGEKYSKYLIDTEGVVRGFNFIYYLIRWIVMIVFYIYYDKIDYSKKDILFYVGCIAIVIGSVDVEIFTRMMEYYMIGFYLMCTVIFRGFSTRDKQVFILILYVLLMIILIRSLYNTSAGTFRYYKLFF